VRRSVSDLQALIALEISKICGIGIAHPSAGVVSRAKSRLVNIFVCAETLLLSRYHSWPLQLILHDSDWTELDHAG
jgi:hypothetical protein